jgi:hypothetical protein
VSEELIEVDRRSCGRTRCQRDGEGEGVDDREDTPEFGRSLASFQLGQPLAPDGCSVG